MMLFRFAPPLSTSAGTPPLYILPSKKMWASASHWVAHWSGMITASSV